MSYSFTEKKRIRKSFAKRESVQEIPYLLAMQLESYKAFYKLIRQQTNAWPLAWNQHSVLYSQSLAILAMHVWIMSAINLAMSHLMSKSANNVALLLLRRCA